MKALKLLEASKTLQERVAEVIPRIKRDSEQAFIEVLERKIDNLKDQIADLSNFSLNTNLNEGQIGTTIEEAKKKFLNILQLEYQLKLAEKELEIKKGIFNDYFEKE